MHERTGCDGIMIGRGAMGNPWLFAEIRAEMEGLPYKKPTVAERMEIAREQLRDMLKQKGERVGLAEGKKHMAWYLSGLNGAATARGAIMRATDAEEICRILFQIQEQNGGCDHV